MTHTSYADNFTAGTNTDSSIRVLQANIKDWIVRGSNYNSSNIMEAVAYLKSTNATLVKATKILFFTEGVDEWTEDNFVKKGGGLFVASTPWGWSQKKKSNNFNLMLTYKTIFEAGIALTSNVIWDSATFYFNKVTYLSHLGIAVDIALSPENTSFNYTNTVKVIDQA